MKILHISPHLGGGVGKAHAAMSVPLRGHVQQIFLLLERPRDKRYLEEIADNGALILSGKHLDEIVTLASAADIVQFEFWNHPRLFECLARCDFPKMRSVFWAHVSGISKPVIQPGLIAQAGKFVFTTRASLSLPYLETDAQIAKEKVAVIESGFGFSMVNPSASHQKEQPRIIYLGTVDFVKMHPGFFKAIDELSTDDIRVSVWGDCDPKGEVVDRVSAMQHPERIIFEGQTSDPLSAMSRGDIFFYPLQPDHYGTAENALIEAMSLGLVPVVLNNPAESVIVENRNTGFICNSIEECTEVLLTLLSSPRLMTEYSERAKRHVASVCTPDIAAKKFLNLWQTLIAEKPRAHQFKKTIGNSPQEWFVATQSLERTMSKLEKGMLDCQKASKGTLKHFVDVFPDENFDALI